MSTPAPPPQQEGGIALLLGAFARLGDQNQQNTSALMGALATPKPIRPLVGGAKVTDGSSPFLLTPSGNWQTGPASGRLWNLRAFGIYGADGHTAVTGVTGVDLYAGDVPDAGGVTQPLAPSFSDLISAGIVALPTFQTYARHAIWCKHGEIPYALIYGVASGVQLTMVAYVEEWALADVEATSV